MPIAFDKLFDVFKEEGVTATINKRENYVSQGSLDRIKKGVGGLDMGTIERLCRVFHRQPGDFYEYIPDDQVEKYTYVWQPKEKGPRA